MKCSKVTSSSWFWQVAGTQTDSAFMYPKLTRRPIPTCSLGLTFIPPLNLMALMNKKPSHVEDCAAFYVCPAIFYFILSTLCHRVKINALSFLMNTLFAGCLRNLVGPRPKGDVGEGARHPAMRFLHSKICLSKNKLRYCESVNTLLYITSVLVEGAGFPIRGVCQYS